MQSVSHMQCCHSHKTVSVFQVTGVFCAPVLYKDVFKSKFESLMALHMVCLLDSVHL